MERLVDKVALLGISLAAYAVVPADAATVVMLLGLFTASVVAGLLPEKAGIAALLVALAACAFCSLAAVFAAPLVYGCVGSRFRWVRFVWLAVPILAFLRLPLDVWAVGAALDVAAAMMSWRCGTLLRERRQYRVLRDGVREQAIALEAKNQRLREQVKELKAADGARDGLGGSARSGQRDPASELRPTLVLANLTERELEIAAHVARGLDNREIAAEVYASEGTVRNHISSILQKSDLHNRTQLAVAYLNALGL